MSSAAAEPSRRGLSIGIRLTLWSSATTLGACGLLCVLMYFGLRDSLVREIDGFIDGEVRELSSIVSEEIGEGGGINELEEDVRRELGSRLRGDLIFRVFETDGRMLLSSELDDPLPNRWTDPRIWKRKAGDPVIVTAPTTDAGTSYRTATAWISLTDGRRYIVQAAYSLKNTERSLAIYRRVAYAALAIVGIAALVGGRIVARRSLRPVEVITQTARQIELLKLHDRIPRSGNGDELDRLAETLNELLARIENQVRRIQQFTADASHEIRTPLAALRGAAEVALSRPRTVEEMREVVESSIEHYIRLGRMADDLLLLASADAGGLPLERKPLNLNDLVVDLVELYAPLAEEQGKQITLEPSDCVMVDADGARIRQVLMNLIDNAMKYNTTGKRITIRVFRRDSEGGVEVEDDGPGIAEANLPHVFDRFYRADSARSGRGESSAGAGLGLAICKTIVEAHGGRIEMQGGGGARAIVCLPLVG